MNNYTIKEKRALLGDGLTVSEFLLAIENDIFSDEATFIIHTENYRGVLQAVYQSEGTNEIYLLGNNHNLFGDTLYEEREVSEILALISKKVFIHKNELTKKELISTLKNIKGNYNVYINTLGDVESGLIFPLTGVYRCTTDYCDTIHLDCSYSEYFFTMN
jgi:hypothetical protein